MRVMAKKLDDIFTYYDCAFSRERTCVVSVKRENEDDHSGSLLLLRVDYGIGLDVIAREL